MRFGSDIGVRSAGIIPIGTLFVLSVLVFPRAYGDVKLALLAGLLALVMISRSGRSYTKVFLRPYVFFALYALANGVALVIGVLSGNAVEALYDGARLGLVFPAILAVLWEELLHFSYLNFVSRVIAWSGVMVFLLILLALFQEILGLQLMSESFVKENLLTVGVHPGYVQVISHNVGSLFFIFGYLIYFLIHSPSKAKKSIEGFALFLVILAALISGRRALMLAIAIFPVFALATAAVFCEIEKVRGRSISYSLILLVWLSIALLYLISSGYLDWNNLIERLLGVFENDDGVRASQYSALMAGFLDQPVFGSGIGGVTEVVRSDDAPWTYELTYVQVLFNFGLFGGVLFVGLFIFESLSIYRKSHAAPGLYDVREKALLNGILYLMFGAATNPYLGSFDFMFFLGVFPFLAAKRSLQKASQKKNLYRERWAVAARESYRLEYKAGACSRSSCEEHKLIRSIGQTRSNVGGLSLL